MKIGEHSYGKEFDILKDCLDEYERAVSKFPLWPADSLHAMAIIGEEYGELVQANLQRIYEKEKGVTVEMVRAEAVQCMAMLLRFVCELDNRKYLLDGRSYFP